MIDLSAIETSRFSQNGEDGIIAWLAARIRKQARTFVEIGCGSGWQNNTTALVHDGWTGAAFDRSAERIEAYRARGFSGVEAHCCAADPTAETIGRIMACVPSSPDLFSLDIDSVDWHVAHAVLGRGFRPAIAVVEYNSVFGPDEAATVPYPMPRKAGHKHLYFGAGLAAWRKLFEGHGYRFVTVESTGINAFFIDPAKVKTGDLRTVRWLDWCDNPRFVAEHGPHTARRALIDHLPLEHV